MKVQRVPVKKNKELKYLRKAVSNFGQETELAEGDIITVTDTTTNIIDYKGKYYALRDFEQLVITNEDGYELRIDDYKYIIDFTDVENLQYETMTITKPLISGCKIQRKGSDIKGIIVDKPIEDGKYNTFGFQYYQANNDLSPVMVGSDEEWYSIDTTRICILLPIEKVKSIIFNNDMDNDFKVRHIQSLLA